MVGSITYVNQIWKWYLLSGFAMAGGEIWSSFFHFTIKNNQKLGISTSKACHFETIEDDQESFANPILKI